MPVRPNLMERTAFYTLNAVPGALLDLAGLFAYQAVSSANELGLFETLAGQSYSAKELADHLQLQERGLLTLLEALEIFRVCRSAKRPLQKQQDDPEMAG